MGKVFRKKNGCVSGVLFCILLETERHLHIINSGAYLWRHRLTWEGEKKQWVMGGRAVDIQGGLTGTLQATVWNQLQNCQVEEGKGYLSWQDWVPGSGEVLLQRAEQVPGAGPWSRKRKKRAK